MTQEEFIYALKNPNEISVNLETSLQEMIGRYPYFVTAKLMLLKISQQKKEVCFESDAKRMANYVIDRRWLYYYLYPEFQLSDGLVPRDDSKRIGGSYFDLIDSVNTEGGESKQMLSELVLKLKSARMTITENMHSEAIASKSSDNDTELVSKNTHTDESDLELKSITLQIKNLIKYKSYQEAISILETLNLNNPKKSVYFADQIRFLKKVIDISKK